MTLPCTGHIKRPPRGGGSGSSACGCCGVAACVCADGGTLATSGFCGGGDGGAPNCCVVIGAKGVAAISGLPGGGAGGASGRATAGGNFNTRPGSTAKGGVSSFIRASE